MSYSYAWANPSTGLREAADSLELAKSTLWGEMHPDGVGQFPLSPYISAVIWERKEAGGVGRVSAALAAPSLEWPDFVWAAPNDARLMVGHVQELVVGVIQDQFQSASPETGDVIVYHAREAAIVRRGDPRPESPAPKALPVPTPGDLIRRINQGEYVDQQQALTLGVLWIAESLQRGIGGNVTFDIANIERTQVELSWWRSLWRRFLEWWNRPQERFWNCPQCGVAYPSVAEAGACMDEHCEIEREAAAATADNQRPTEQERAEMRQRFVASRPPISPEDLEKMAEAHRKMTEGQQR